MVKFAIDPKISKSGKDAYAITSGAPPSGWRASSSSPALAKTASVQQQDAVVARARELAALFDRLADVLELHTDYSLWESYQRLDAIEKIQNPDFAKTLFENAVNQYCLSHQYEAIRYVVAPAMAELAERIAKAVKSGDRKAAFSVHPRFAAIRKAAKAKPLESLKPAMPRTQENFVKILREVERCGTAIHELAPCERQQIMENK